MSIKEIELNNDTGNKITKASRTCWGRSLCIDCYECDSELIRNSEAIKQFTSQLVNLIDMKSYGPCHVVHFGSEPGVSGFSMFQFIETSCISAHFVNETNSAYIDIFSCKNFDDAVAAEFCKTYFKADQVKTALNIRK